MGLFLVKKTLLEKVLFDNITIFFRISVENKKKYIMRKIARNGWNGKAHNNTCEQYLYLSIDLNYYITFWLN